MPYAPADLLVLKAELKINGVWTDATSRGRAAGKVRIRHAGSDGANGPQTSRCEVTIGNDDSWLTEGNVFSPWHPIGRGTQIRLSLAGILPADAGRFCGEIDRMEAVYPGGSSSAMKVEAIGTWGVLAQDDEVVRSATWRAITTASPVPVIYWPLALGKERNVSPPQIPAGGPPMLGRLDPLFGNALPDWSGGNVASWLEQGADLGREGTAVGAVPPMPAGWVNTDGWTVDVTCNVGHKRPPEESPAPLLYVTGVGPIPTIDWDIEIQPAGGVDPVVTADTIHLGFFEVTDPFTSTATILTSQPHPVFDGQPHQIRLSVEQSGADIFWVLSADGTQLASGTVAAKTLQAPTRVELNTFRVDRYAQYAVNDVVIWPDNSVPEIAAAALGYAGETADERIQRLCDEAGIPVTIIGASSTVMGPQRLQSRIELLLDAWEADDGLMSDDLTDIGLVYRCRSHLSTQTPRVKVIQGTITPDTRPIWDYQQIRNEWTVSRIDGATVTQSDEDHIARIRRRRKGSAQLNVASDDVLDHQARFRVHLGTSGGPRYPGLGLNLRNVDGARLADQVLALIPGDRMTIADAAWPSQHPPGDADQMVLGWEELLDADTWELRPATIPYQPYDLVGRWSLISKVLHAPVSASATSVDIANTDTGQPMLATSAALVGSGYPITVGTEDMQLTAVADALVTFGTAGTASSGSSGSRTPGMPASTVAGNLVIIYASSRNSGTGVPDTPANWTRWPIFPANANAQVFARIWDGVWSMPTVTYTGGSANEDTIAQSCRLGGNWYDASKVLIGSASRLNTSAANVTYPGLAKPIADNSIIFYFAWKADDYTSIAGPGTEIQEASSTAGNDASQSWAYAIQTTAATVPSGTFVPTGGGSAISRGAVAAVRCDYQVATVQRSINGVSASHSAGDAVTKTDQTRWGLL